MATQQPITRICSPGVGELVYLQSECGRTCEIYFGSGLPIIPWLVATGAGVGVIMCNCVNVPMSQQYRGHSSPPLGPAIRDRGGGTPSRRRREIYQESFQFYCIYLVFCQVKILD